MAHLSLALLGPFQATLDGDKPDGLNSDRLRALLAYLAVERGREQRRESLAALLWPERPDREALSSLRYSLSNLHHALADRSTTHPFLIVTRSSVQFNAESDHWLDVAEFERLAGVGRGDPAVGRGDAVPGRGDPAVGRGDAAVGRGDPAPTELQALEAAARLYRGPFLDGLSVGDSPAFDEWMLLREEEYRRRVLSVLGRLTSRHTEHGNYVEAARWARRQVELDPYREQAHRQLMAALALGGERPAALAQYEACRRLLAEELGCEPDDETQALCARIRAGARGLSVSPPLVIPERSGVDRVSASPPLPRFVARERELARLDALLEQALAGCGGLALIAGEAGAGKTALLDEFARRAGQAHGDLIALRGRCSAYGGAGDPYLPFREMLQTLAGDVEGQRAGGILSAEQARRAWDALPAVGAALVEHGPDLIDTFVPGGALLRRVEGFRTSAGAGAPTGQVWRARLREMALRSQEETAIASPGAGAARPARQPDLFAQVTRVLQSVSSRGPLLLAIDDLQWADGGTAALLFHLGRHLAGSRILLVCAFRPEAQTDLGGLGPVFQEFTREWGDVLVDLDRVDGRAFVEAYVDSEPNRLGASFRQALYHHTEGNPLFTVELLRTLEREGALVQDEGGRWMEAAGLDWERWPPQVEAVIAGHLAGLPEEDRALLQAASIQGEQFIAEVAARVLGWDEEAAVRRLSGPLNRPHRLVGAERLERLPSSGQRVSHYRFRHLLVQRSAYGSLDAVARARLHEAVGRALEAIYAPAPGGQGEQPAGLAAELARHYEAAGMATEAARALYDAGRQAMRVSALREALGMFDHALELLAHEQPSPERAEVEQRLQVERMGPQASLEGTGSAQLVDALARAKDAGTALSQGRPKLLMLQAHENLLDATGQFEEGLVVAEQMLEEATKCSDEVFMANAIYWTGHLQHLMGKPLEAHSSFERAIARLTPERDADLRAAAGFALSPLVLSFSALNQCMLGYPVGALARSAAAVAGALERGDLYGQAFASAIGSMTLFLLRSDAAAVQARAEFAQRLSLQEGYAWWQAYSEVFLGWLALMSEDPDGDQGIECMRSAIAKWQATGMVVGTDGLMVLLADGCLAAERRGRAANGPEAAGDGAVPGGWLSFGLAAIEPFLGPEVACGQSFQSELLRMRGELLLAREGLAASVDALACFEQALQLGREQGALAWELRAAMSLVRLRERESARGAACATELVEARRCLRDVYARFTEGFSFPDLTEAATLFGEMKRRTPTL